MSTMIELIERREGAKGGRPLLKETKLSVLQIAELVYDDEMTPGEIVSAYPNVDSERLVYAALQYYDDHPEEMEHYLEERERATERLRERATVY